MIEEEESSLSDDELARATSTTVERVGQFASHGILCPDPDGRLNSPTSRA